MNMNNNNKNNNIKTWEQFVNVNGNEKINHPRIWRNTFEYKGNSYRLSSWMYIYEFSDGSNTFVPVNKEDANGVSGIGVAGVIAKLEDIKWSERTTSFTDNFIKQKEMYYNQRVSNNKDRHELLKSLPKNLSREEFDDIVIELAFDSAMKSYPSKA